MSRLDAEYDPAEHHDLDRIEEHLHTPIPDRFVAVCACGDVGPGSVSREAAFQTWDQHRHREWFG